MCLAQGHIPVTSVRLEHAAQDLLAFPSFPHPLLSPPLSQRHQPSPRRSMLTMTSYSHSPEMDAIRRRNQNISPLNLTLVYFTDQS